MSGNEQRSGAINVGAILSRLRCDVLRCVLEISKRRRWFDDSFQTIGAPDWITKAKSCLAGRV